MSGASVRVLVGTVGGQGGGLLTAWLVRGLQEAGWDATSIGLLGLSQRAGTVTYYCEAAPRGGALVPGSPALREPEPGRGRRHVSVFAVPGDVNLLVGQELLELGRLIAGGYASRDCVIVGNTARTYTTLEKMPAEGGIYDGAAIVAAARRLAPGRSAVCDAPARVAAAGLPALSANAFLLGVAVASPALALPQAPFLRAIGAAGVDVEVNRRAFALGHDLQARGELARATGDAEPERAALAAAVAGAPGAGSEDVRPEHRASFAELIDALPTWCPAAAVGPVRQVVARLLDYQDVAYARGYLGWVQALAALPSMRAGTVAAFARHAGSWLSYEDVPRVAQLKTRPERFARLLADHGVGPGQRVVVTDFLSPDVEQLTGMLPARLGRALRRAGRALSPRFESWSFPLRLRSSSPLGYWTLRALAAARRWRPGSLRFAEEREAVVRWGEAIRAWHVRSPVLGELAAEAGRVVKGYARVRRLALADLRGFLDEGLPALARLEARGGDAETVGREALALLAREAGSLARCRGRIDAALAARGDRETVA